MSDEECECKAGAPAWMATFSDMATLMLCFFVLLLSFANMDVENFRTALGSVKEAFGVQFKVQGNFEAMSTSPVELSNVQSSERLFDERAIDEESMAVVEEFIRSKGLEETLEVAGDPRGVIIRAKDNVLFDSGQALLKDDALPTLSAVRELFEEFSGLLAIEGHTDDRPIATLEFPSNWELSGARAASVLRQMHQEGLPLDQVHIAGYADLHPVAPNNSDDGRASNRRVEFVFEYAEEFVDDPSKAFNVDNLNLDNDKIRLDALDKAKAKRLPGEPEEHEADDEAAAEDEEESSPVERAVEEPIDLFGEGFPSRPNGRGKDAADAGNP